MAKKTVAAQAGREGSTMTYQVAEGVDRINGKKVTGKTVELTPSEALYELSLGRITEKVPGDGGA